MQKTENSFITIKNNDICELVEKNSRFIAIAQFVECEIDVKKCLKRIKSEYSDSTHICYAYVIGNQSEYTKSCDNGEPAGSAGMAILDSIRKHNLTNALVAVVRYFGGKKLGVSGLFKAYSCSTSKVLDKIEKCKMVECVICECSFDYTEFPKIERYLRENNYSILFTDYLDKIIIKIAIPKYKKQYVIMEISSIVGMNFVKKELECMFIEN